MQEALDKVNKEVGQWDLGPKSSASMCSHPFSGQSIFGVIHLGDFLSSVHSFSREGGKSLALSSLFLPPSPGGQLENVSCYQSCLISHTYSDSEIRS